MNKESETPLFTDRPLGGEASTKDFVMERRWLPGADGAFTDGIAYTNVAHQVVDLSPPGFDWGNSGAGSYDLALNILEAALRRLGHRGPRAARRDGSCFILALLLRGRFATTFVEPLPKEGGIIAGDDVDRWLDILTETLDPAQRALLTVRYAFEGCGSGEHWSASELAEILDEPVHERADGLFTTDGRLVAQALEPHPLDVADWESMPL